nr:MAG: hypothetical protein 1 [Barnaviridae sp.]
MGLATLTIYTLVLVIGLLLVTRPTLVEEVRGCITSFVRGATEMALQKAETLRELLVALSTPVLAVISLVLFLWVLHETIYPVLRFLLRKSWILWKSRSVRKYSVVDSSPARLVPKIKADEKGVYGVVRLEDGRTVEVQLPVWCSLAMGTPAPSPQLESLVENSPIWGCKSQTGLACILREDGKAIGMGSRVRLGDNTYLLTAHHVLETARQSNGKVLLGGATKAIEMSRDWKLYGWSATNQLDIALVEVPDWAWTSLGVKALNMRRMPVKASVSVFGKASSGAWLQSTGIAQPCPLFGRIGHLASTKPGWSGSPLISAGAVIGVHITGHTDKNYAVACDVLMSRSESDQPASAWKQRSQDFEDDYEVDSDGRDTPVQEDYDEVEVRIGGGKVSYHRSRRGEFYAPTQHIRPVNLAYSSWADEMDAEEDDESPEWFEDNDYGYYGTRESFVDAEEGEETEAEDFRQASTTPPLSSASTTSGATPGTKVPSKKKEFGSEELAQARSREELVKQNAPPPPKHTSSSQSSTTTSGPPEGQEESSKASSTTEASSKGKTRKSRPRKNRKKSSPGSSGSTQEPQSQKGSGSTKGKKEDRKGKGKASPSPRGRSRTRGASRH